MLSAFLPAFACLLLLPLPAPPRCLLSRCPLVPFLDKPMVALKRSPLVLLARLRRLRLPCVPGPRSCSCPVCSFSANLFAAIWYSGSVLPPSCSSQVFSSPYICSFIYIYIYIGVPCPVDTPSLGGGRGPTEQRRGGPLLQFLKQIGSSEDTENRGAPTHHEDSNEETEKRGAPTPLSRAPVPFQ